MPLCLAVVAAAALAVGACTPAPESHPAATDVVGPEAAPRDTSIRIRETVGEFADCANCPIMVVLPAGRVPDGQPGFLLWVGKLQ